MKVDELIKQLEKYEGQDLFCYINYEQNWEDNFAVRLSDAGNVLLIPHSKYGELKDSQEFYFVED